MPVADLDIARHVTLHPTVERDDPDHVEVLTGRLNGPMDPSRPLWDIRIIELDSGRVAIVARYHHVIGDALFGLRIGEVVAGTESSAAIPEVTDAERAALGVAPRTGFGILAIAFRAWRAGSTASAARGTSTGASRSSVACGAGAAASSGR